ncbi:hypothetical protein P7C73_g1633, partial [Tremellales sp. Uapishka_1]
MMTRASTPGRAKTPTRTTRTTSETPSAFTPANKMDRYTQEWKREFLPKDPVFSSMPALLRLETSIKRSIQPWDHSRPELLPNIAQRFGLQRFLPSPDMPFGSGHTCVDGCKAHTKCFPAFMYTHGQLVCSRCKERGIPSIISKYSIRSQESPDGSPHVELVSMSCWVCATKKIPHCSMMGTAIPQIGDDGSVYSPGEQPDIESVDASDSELSSAGDAEDDSGNTPMASRYRKASDTGFERPEGKRTQTAPPSGRAEQLALTETKPITAPSSTSTSADAEASTLRPGRAYLQRKQNRTITFSLPPPDESHEPPSGLWINKVAPPRSVSDPLFPASNANHTSPLPTSKPALRSPSDSALHVNSLALRSQIESALSSSTIGAREHLAHVDKLEKEAKASIDELFAWCDRLMAEAQADREQIESVRQDRERLQGDLKTMDSRMAKYSSLIQSKDDFAKELQVKVDFLEKHLEDSKRDQHEMEQRLLKEQNVVEQRMVGAVRERDLAYISRNEGEELRKKAIEECNRAIAERDRALIQVQRMTENVSEVELSLEDACNETDEARANLSNAKEEIAALRFRLEELGHSVNPTVRAQSPNDQPPLETSTLNRTQTEDGRNWQDDGMGTEWTKSAERRDDGEASERDDSGAYTPPEYRHSEPSGKV